MIKLLLDKFSYNCYYEKIGENEPIKLEDLPFKIPENWTWVRLKNMVCIETGKKDANFGSVDGNYNFYTCALEPIKSKSYTYDGEYLILPGNGANIGKSIHFIGKFEAYQRTYLLSKTLSTLNFKYLKYVLDIFWESWNKSRMFGSAIPYIKLINLEKFTIPLPPLVEQERIVKKIQLIDLLIQQYNEYETQLTELESEFEEKIKKSILQYAIQGKLVKQDTNDQPASELIRKIYDEKQKLISEGKIKRDKYESHIYQGTDKNYYEKIDKNEPIKLEDLPFEIPKNWTWVRQENICWLQNGKKEYSGELPYLEAKVMRGLCKPKIINCGIFVNELNTLILVDGENSGEIMVPSFEGYMGSTFKIFLSSNFVNYYYLMFIFKLNKTKYKNTKIGAAIPHLNKELFKKSYIALPPLAEQERIIKKIQSIDLLIQQNDEKY